MKASLSLNSTHSLKIDVLLVDDHEMFRQGLARVFAKEPNFSIVGQCASVSEALSLLAQARPNMVLLDVDLGSERALDFVTKARKQGFGGKILVVTAGITGQEAVQLVKGGVAGILHKHHSADMLCETIRKVAGGKVHMEQAYLGAPVSNSGHDTHSHGARLTERDKVVLRLKPFQGLTNKDLSTRLEISESGAKSALRQLFGKLGVRTRAQLVKVALEQYKDQLSD